ncbi:MAG: T9SS type A sorting domain-containing protein [bacterium]
MLTLTAAGRRLVAVAGLLTVAATTAAAQPKPYVEFLGERFLVTKGEMEGSLGVGYDPILEQVQSVKRTTRCGDFVAFVDGENGIAWDYVNEEFWYLRGNRELYHYVNGMQTLIFTIPEVFDVPGAGPDTLESPQGLALDMNYVYVVDTGPNLGALDSNAWFKFERDGTPVSSSKLTDFHANLGPHLAEGGDVVADGITWIPDSAPGGAGLFLVAIEHSGMQVLDANGNYIDRLLWSEAGLVLGESAPFAFAGIAVDPARGDLYLVENSGQQMHVWLRLDPALDESIVHGVWGTRLHGPETGCSRRLPLTPSLNFFSLTYRDVDGMLWTNEFNSGVAYTIDPKSGKATEVGPTGVNDVWGMAWDPERDVIYLFRELGGPTGALHRYDPNTGLSTLINGSVPFMRELAFDSDDQHIYGVGWDGSQSVLVRVDRDTGAGTFVGPTVPGQGIAYDRMTQTLVVIESATHRLYDVNPADGTAVIRGNSATAGWEGLAAIPIVDEASGVIEVPRAPGSVLASPNPTNGAIRVQFATSRPEPVSARILDVRGRVIRTLPDSRVGAIDRTFVWDGRSNGAPVPAGIYFVEIRQGNARESAKITVLR